MLAFWEHVCLYLLAVLSGCICLLFFPVSLFSPYKSWVCGPCHHIPSTSRQVAPLRGTSFPREA